MYELTHSAQNVTPQHWTARSVKVLFSFLTLQTVLFVVALLQQLANQSLSCFVCGKIIKDGDCLTGGFWRLSCVLSTESVIDDLDNYLFKLKGSLFILHPCWMPMNTTAFFLVSYYSLSEHVEYFLSHCSKHLIINCTQHKWRFSSSSTAGVFPLLPFSSFLHSPGRGGKLTGNVFESCVRLSLAWN